jgi:hypothetical protein
VEYLGETFYHYINYYPIRITLPKSIDNLTQLDDDSKEILQNIKTEIVNAEETLWKRINNNISLDLEYMGESLYQYIN